MKKKEDNITTLESTPTESENLKMINILASILTFNKEKFSLLNSDYLIEQKLTMYLEANNYSSSSLSYDEKFEEYDDDEYLEEKKKEKKRIEIENYKKDKIEEYFLGYYKPKKFEDLTPFEFDNSKQDIFINEIFNELNRLYISGVNNKSLKPEDSILLKYKEFEKGIIKKDDNSYKIINKEIILKGIETLFNIKKDMFEKHPIIYVNVLNLPNKKNPFFLSKNIIASSKKETKDDLIEYLYIGENKEINFIYSKNEKYNNSYNIVSSISENLKNETNYLYDPQFFKKELLDQSKYYYPHFFNIGVITEGTENFYTLFNLIKEDKLLQMNYNLYSNHTSNIKNIDIKQFLKWAIDYELILIGGNNNINGLEYQKHLIENYIQHFIKIKYFDILESDDNKEEEQKVTLPQIYTFQDLDIYENNNFNNINEIIVHQNEKEFLKKLLYLKKDFSQKAIQFNDIQKIDIKLKNTFFNKNLNYTYSSMKNKLEEHELENVIILNKTQLNIKTHNNEWVNYAIAINHNNKEDVILYNLGLKSLYEILYDKKLIHIPNKKLDTKITIEQLIKIVENKLQEIENIQNKLLIDLKDKEQQLNLYKKNLLNNELKILQNIKSDKNENEKFEGQLSIAIEFLNILNIENEKLEEKIEYNIIDNNNNNKLFSLFEIGIYKNNPLEDILDSTSNFNKNDLEEIKNIELKIECSDIHKEKIIKDLKEKITFLPSLIEKEVGKAILHPTKNYFNLPQSIIEKSNDNFIAINDLELENYKENINYIQIEGIDFSKLTKEKTFYKNITIPYFLNSTELKEENYKELKNNALINYLLTEQDTINNNSSKEYLQNILSKDNNSYINRKELNNILALNNKTFKEPIFKAQYLKNNILETIPLIEVNETPFDNIEVFNNIKDKFNEIEKINQLVYLEPLNQNWGIVINKKHIYNLLQNNKTKIYGRYSGKENKFSICNEKNEYIEIKKEDNYLTNLYLKNNEDINQKINLIENYDKTNHLLLYKEQYIDFLKTLDLILSNEEINILINSFTNNNYQIDKVVLLQIKEKIFLNKNPTFKKMKNEKEFDYRNRIEIYKNIYFNQLPFLLKKTDLKLEDENLIINKSSEIINYNYFKHINNIILNKIKEEEQKAIDNDTKIVLKH
jgi:hypothetical protein